MKKANITRDLDVNELYLSNWYDFFFAFMTIAPFKMNISK